MATLDLRNLDMDSDSLAGGTVRERKGRTPELSDDILRQFAGSRGEGDGTNPLETKRIAQRERRRDKANHAQERLASQMERVLSLSLHEVSSTILEGVSVVKVVPAERRNTFEVQVTSIDSEIQRAPQILKELEGSKGQLKELIANGINRKKIPDFTFKYVSNTTE